MSTTTITTRRRTLGLLLGALASSATWGAGGMEAAPPAPGDAFAALHALSPAERQATLEREARREGRLVLYGATGVDRAQFWIAEFNRRHPDIEVDFVRLQAAELYQKIATERRTGRLHADLVITTITYLDLLRDAAAFAPYEPAEWNDFDPRFRMGGYGQGWTAVVYEVFPHAIAWRTDRIGDADAPRSLQAVANPKWRGRLGTTTHLEDFLNAMVARLGPDKGMALVRALAAQRNRLYPSHAALSDALAAGEVDVAWGLIAARPLDLARKGAPVAHVLEDPQVAEGNTIAIGRDTTSPYAAALFVDVMLSPQVLEASDRWQGGRLFGNRRGSYSIPSDHTAELFIFPPLSPARYKELNRLAEELFVR